jgi:hypothetical protein
MEPDEERIAYIVRTTGATEGEARALHHIQAAGRALWELPIDGAESIQTTLWEVHIDALLNSVLSRIAKRDHPEGWPHQQEGPNIGSEEP